jgi:hypothetical protein
MTTQKQGEIKMENLNLIMSDAILADIRDTATPPEYRHGGSRYHPLAGGSKPVRRAPIRVYPGDAKPTLTGHSYYWTTPSGDLVHHPLAYMSHFGRPIYHYAKWEICVGLDWLTDHYMDLTAGM